MYALCPISLTIFGPTPRCRGSFSVTHVKNRHQYGTNSSQQLLFFTQGEDDRF